MSESGFSLGKDVAAQMVEDFLDGDSKGTKSIYNTMVKGKSLKK